MCHCEHIIVNCVAITRKRQPSLIICWVLFCITKPCMWNFPCFSPCNKVLHNLLFSFAVFENLFMAADFSKVYSINTFLDACHGSTKLLFRSLQIHTGCFFHQSWYNWQNQRTNRWTSSTVSIVPLGRSGTSFEYASSQWHEAGSCVVHAVNNTNRSKWSAYSISPKWQMTRCGTTWYKRTDVLQVSSDGNILRKRCDRANCDYSILKSRWRLHVY